MEFVYGPYVHQRPSSHLDGVSFLGYYALQYSRLSAWDFFSGRQDAIQHPRSHSISKQPSAWDFVPGPLCHPPSKQPIFKQPFAWDSTSSIVQMAICMGLHAIQYPNDHSHRTHSLATVHPTCKQTSNPIGHLHPTSKQPFTWDMRLQSLTTMPFNI